jgi:probable rRNA maturation factor
MAKATETGIYFHYLVDTFYFPQRTRVKSFIASVLKKHKRKIDSINFIFCTDAYLLEVNKKYLKHNFLTDIITFEMSGKGEPLLADIFISIERVKENASNYEIPFKTELQRVMFHGILHLLGYKDKTSNESELMRQMENRLLDSFKSST